MKRITIGRNEACDFRVPQSYETVSNMHADIEEHNGRLFFEDHSSNGSIVNGRRIKHEKMEIQYGDDIKLSSSYTLLWHDILQFFPNIIGNSSAQQGNYVSRPTTMHNTPVNPLQDSGAYRRDYQAAYVGGQNDSQEQNFQNQVDIARARSGWNWGAFLLGWIWGVGHSCWWPLLLQLGLGFICGILIIVAPLVGTLTYSLVGTLSFALSVYLGVKGNTIGWDNGCYENIEHFRKKEKNWTIAGFVVWGIYALGILLILVSVFSVFNSFNG